jgi:hypothetical protein
MPVHKLCKAGNLRFNRKSGPDFSPIRPIFLRACYIANKVCAPCALAHSRLVLEQAPVIMAYFLLRLIQNTYNFNAYQLF